MIVGIDLGGTQVRVAIADAEGRIAEVARVATIELDGPAGMVAWAREQAGVLAGGAPIEIVGIGVPGPCDPHAGILTNPPNLAGWPPGVPLGTLLREAFGVPVHLENDANLAALSEFRRGAGRGSRNLAYVTWSTGIGSGLILDGKLYSGTNGTAGEIGHMVLDPQGPPCMCGMRGCVEAYASGSSIARRAGRPASEVFAGAAAGEPGAIAIVEQAALMVGLALLNLANLVDPERIVIGGGITGSWHLIEEALGRPIRDSPFMIPARRPAILKAELGVDVGLVGAVEWALQHR